MRKSLIIAIVLLLLAAAGVLLLSGWMNGKRDRVEITEEVVSGDPAAAEGLTVTTRANCNRRLFWTMCHPIGGGTETAFEYHNNEVFEPFAYPATDLYFDTFGSYWSLDESAEAPGMAKVVKDVFSRAPEGETYRERVYLRDYYEFYPLTVSIGLPYPIVSYYEMNEKAIADFIKIPVAEDAVVEVEVSRSGNDINTSLGPVSGVVQLNTLNVVSGTACYFTFSREWEGMTVDMSHIPGGYGIYRLPFTLEDGNAVLEADELGTVYSLGDGVNVVGLEASMDGESLLLFTIEDGEYVMSVIDIETMKCTQKLSLLPCKEEDYSYCPRYIYEDFIVLVDENGNFALAAVNDGGRYELRFTGNLENFFNAENMGYSNLVMAYDGERLAVVRDSGSYYLTGYFAAVYGEEGERCIISCRCSLDKNQYLGGEWSYTCHLCDMDPIVAAWG